MLKGEMIGVDMTRVDFLVGMLGSAAVLLIPWSGFSFHKENQQENTGFLYDEVYLDHDTGEFHPERPARLLSIRKMVEESGRLGTLANFRGAHIDLDVVSQVHDPNYIEKVRQECEAGYEGLSTGDTAICPRTYSIALKAAGGVIGIVDAVLDGKIKNAFCAIRPPGHHASRKRGMGFCVFNNIAIAARYAQKKYGIERVLIGDWDVHHGNGTQDIFYTDPSVFFMSTHQYPWYPGTGHSSETGEGKGKGYTLNKPFPAGAGNKEIINAFRNDFLTAAKKFKPDLTLISAGFDSRIGDPLGFLRIDDQGFRELTKIMLEISQISGNGRLISVLEGGYSLEGLASAVSVHLDELSKA